MYLGLLLKEDQGIVLVMKQETNGLICIDKEGFRYSNGWENLVGDIDETLFKLENRLKFHFTETIIYLYSHLIDPKTKEIKKEYLHKIKEMLKSLELKPLGYIETYEAVAQFLEDKEKLSLTSILVELDKSHISVFVYKGGRLAFNKNVARTDNLVEDFSASLEELKGTMLPARIILYNSSDLDDEAMTILTYRWSEDLFIQLPRVEVIKEQETISGLVSVFQEQLYDQRENRVKEEIVEEEGPKEVMGFKIGSDVEPERIEQQSSRIIPFLKSIMKKLSFRSLPTLQGNSKIMLLVGVILIAFGLLVNEYFFHTAQLTIYLPSYRSEKSLVLHSEIGIAVSTISARLTDSKSTTGKKEIGEKAKGEVTVHNFSASVRSFKAGTVIEYSANAFVLNQDVSVASASNVLLNGSLVKQPGKTKAGVTATQIGAQANFDKGKQFSIEGLPSDVYLAINDSPFSGGSKREVRTVSKKDTEDLRSSILEKAKYQNEQNGTFKELKGKGLLEQLSEQKISDMQLSKEVGEESDTVAATAGVNTMVYSYDKDELSRYLLRIMADTIPKGFTLSKERLTYQFEKMEKKNQVITLGLKAVAVGAKEIREEDIKKRIVFQQEGSLKKMFSELYEIKAYRILIKQPLPFFRQTVPPFKKNISITFSVL